MRSVKTSVLPRSLIVVEMVKTTVNSWVDSSKETTHGFSH